MLTQKLHDCKRYYKYKTNKLPWYLYNLPFCKNIDRLNHFTRAPGNLHIMRRKHDYARCCIRYRISVIVNESPPEIINKIDTHSLQGFSKYIKIKKKL